MTIASSRVEIGHHHHAATTPTGVLREEHEVILRALTVLERIGQQMAKGTTVKPETLQGLTNFFKNFADRCHHAKEEQHLFPALERHGVPKEGGPLGVMLYEHEEGRALVRTFAEGDPKTAPQAIRRYVTLLREHIAKENEILFPLSETVLPSQEQHELFHAFETAEQELGKDLHDRLVAELSQLESEVTG